MGQAGVGRLRPGEEGRLRWQLHAVRLPALALRTAPDADHPGQRLHGVPVRAKHDVPSGADRRAPVHQGPAAIVVRRIDRTLDWHTIEIEIGKPNGYIRVTHTRTRPAITR